MTFTWLEVLAGMALGFFVLLFSIWAGVPGVGAMERVQICHLVPPTAVSPARMIDIEVGAPAVSAHLRHGDILGVCRTSAPTSTPTPCCVLVPPVATATPDTQEPTVTPLTETSSTAESPVVVGLPVTGITQSKADTWPLLLGLVGLLSTGMAFTLRIRQG